MRLNRTFLLCIFPFLYIIHFVFPLFSEEVHIWGSISGPEVKKYGVAIPTFLPEQNSLQLVRDEIKPVILNDLEIAGIFVRVKNEQFVDQQRKTDIAAGNIDYKEWSRLGASVLVLGNYTISGSDFEARCEVYDVVSQKVVFRKKYPSSMTQLRLLAHTIADDIVSYYAAGRVGISRTKILYVSNFANPGRVDKKDIYMMDVDGENKIRLTFDNNLAATPCWGANATEFYYTSYKNYNPDLYGQYLFQGGSWIISQFPGFNISPNYSLVNNKIVLTLGKDGNSEIYVMDRNGRNLKRLTYNARAIDSSPGWSPQGNQIIFTSDKTGRPQIYIMDADGLNQRQLTMQGKYNDSAVFSPKGDKIAFSAQSQGRFNIYTMDINGRNWFQLTGVSRDEGNNEDPAWAPDGEHIAFASDRTGTAQIYIMSSDGSTVRKLTNKGINTSPAWSPLLYK